MQLAFQDGISLIMISKEICTEPENSSTTVPWVKIVGSTLRPGLAVSVCVCGGGGEQYLSGKIEGQASKQTDAPKGQLIKLDTWRYKQTRQGQRDIRSITPGECTLGTFRSTLYISFHFSKEAAGGCSNKRLVNNSPHLISLIINIRCLRVRGRCKDRLVNAVISTEWCLGRDHAVSLFSLGQNAMF